MVCPGVELDIPWYVLESEVIGGNRSDTWIFGLMGFDGILERVIESLIYRECGDRVGRVSNR